MKKYFRLLNHILANGDEHHDRTGVGTISTFGYQETFDLRKGFPLLTTKKMFMRGIVEELIWFLQGRTDNQWLADRKVGIWDAWATPEQCARFGREPGDLGKIYGEQWRSFGSWSASELCPARRPSPSAIHEQPFMGLVYDPEKTGTVAQPTTHDEHGHQLADITFNSTGFTIEGCRTDVPVKDPFKPSVAGVGYPGPKREGRMHALLRTTWTHMLSRCYNPACKEFAHYGAKGVTVCRRWHCFAAFFDDVQKLTGYMDKLRNPGAFELDKDHLGGQVYSPSTCIWMPQAINKAYRDARPFVAVSPDGKSFYHIHVPSIAAKFGLRSHSINRCLRGERPHHRGWKFQLVEDRGLGFTGPTDQVAALVHDLQHNPGSRRLIVSGWDPATATQVALPPCHTIFQCKVTEKERVKYLDLQLYQRSADSFLGVPFNIASYALLTHLLAHVTGMVARNFVHTFGDLHIYKNHVDQVKLQMSRDPFDLPTIRLNPKLFGGGFDALMDFKVEDVELLGYKHHDAIKAPVAV